MTRDGRNGTTPPDPQSEDAKMIERLREAAERWMPGVDFGPDLLRQAAERIEELERDNKHAYHAYRELTEGRP